MKPTITTNVLTQAEQANNINLPYKPNGAFMTEIQRCVARGYLAKGINGGFWLSDDGKRRLRKDRA